MRLRHLALLLALCPAAAHADEFDGKGQLTADDRAAIEADREAAHKAVEEKFQGDNSAEARRAKQDAFRAADEEVLQKKGVSDRDYLWQSSHDAPETQREVTEKKQAIVEKRKADAEAAKAEKPAAAAEPEVVKGFSDDKPLEVGGETAPAKPPALDENGNPLPVVEKAAGADAEGAAKAEPESAKPARHRRGR